MWKIDNILNQFKRYAANIYEALQGIESVDEENLQNLINTNYRKTECISIDYAVLEKSKDIYVVPSDIGWDDIGSWKSMDRYREKDTNGNIKVGNVRSLNSTNNIIISSTKEIVVSDLKDIFIVEADNKIIVGKKSNIDKIGEIRNSI